MRIALDAMGGDYAPREVVRGAVEAVAGLPEISRIFLVGDSTAIKRELSERGGDQQKLEIRHASEVVEMDESPAQAVRRKKDSSIGRAVDGFCRARWNRIRRIVHRKQNQLFTRRRRLGGSHQDR